MGGVLDQPATEIRKLETVLAAYGRWEELESKKSSARNRNRRRHEPVKTREVIE